MTKSIQAIRGMNDILPTEINSWQNIESILFEVVSNYGYQEIRFPLLESTALFARSIGDVTDIVEKEMYTFVDRSGHSISLRPEGTAGCIRACIQHALLRHKSQRLWYYGPMFRHERPQQGRYRQFYQLGVEALNMTGAEINAELILMSARFWKRLGVEQSITLELNSIGNFAERADYRDILIQYLNQYKDELDEDNRRRLWLNPLRILDSKDPSFKSIIEQSPKILDHLQAASKQQFSKLCQYLDAAGLKYTINPHLVRGLDYYTGIVFEWTSTELGAQATVCAGGCYDELVEELGGKSTPASGFAVGIERLVALYDQRKKSAEKAADVYWVLAGSDAQQQGFLLSERLRDEVPGLKMIQHCREDSMKSQFKKADQSGAAIALILGDEEIKNNCVGVKFLREQNEQIQIPQSEICNYLRKVVNV